MILYPMRGNGMEEEEHSTAIMCNIPRQLPDGGTSYDDWHFVVVLPYADYPIPFKFMKELGDELGANYYGKRNWTSECEKELGKKAEDLLHDRYMRVEVKFDGMHNIALFFINENPDYEFCVTHPLFKNRLYYSLANYVFTFGLADEIKQVAELVRKQDWDYLRDIYDGYSCNMTLYLIVSLGFDWIHEPNPIADEGFWCPPNKVEDLANWFDHLLDFGAMPDCLNGDETKEKEDEEHGAGSPGTAVGD